MNTAMTHTHGEYFTIIRVDSRHHIVVRGGTKHKKFTRVDFFSLLFFLGSRSTNDVINDPKNLKKTRYFSLPQTNLFWLLTIYARCVY